MWSAYSLIGIPLVLSTTKTYFLYDKWRLEDAALQHARLRLCTSCFCQYKWKRMHCVSTWDMAYDLVPAYSWRLTLIRTL